MMTQPARVSRVRPAATAAIVLFALSIFAATAFAGVSEQYRVRIDRAVIDLEEGVIRISGDNFGLVPVVEFGGEPLELVSRTTDELQARLPDHISPGTYAVVVSRNRLDQDVIHVTFAIADSPMPQEEGQL